MELRPNLWQKSSMEQLYLSVFWRAWLLLVLLCLPTLVYAQEENGQRTPPDSVRNEGMPPDSIEAGTRSRPPGGGAPSDQGSGGEPSGEQIKFQAKDSLVFTFDGQREGALYGQASVEHQAGQLKSGRIGLNLDENLMDAKALDSQDTLSHPVLTREDKRIRSEKIRFNYNTERGKFNAARVSVKQGILTGQEVKNKNKEEVFVRDGIYSTCKLDHPHYYIKAKRMKVVEQEEIFFTNARLYILDIPYPLIIPFGYVPAKIEQRRSGLLEPTYSYQNTNRRGLGLQNFGWFQHINPYLTGEASFDIYTSGTFAADAQLDYSKRYKYNGNVQIGYSREQGLEPTDPDYQQQVEKKISINHNQDISPYARFSTNINLRTSGYNRRNSYDIDERSETSTSSRMSYNYDDPNDNFSFSLSASGSQNFRNNRTSISGPTSSFSLSQLSPFQPEENLSRNYYWYETLSIRYSNSFESEFSYQPIARDSATVSFWDALTDPDKYREATDEIRHIDYGFSQRANMSMNLLPGGFINLNANASINEYWYPTTIRKYYDAEADEVKNRLERGFATARDFRTGLSASTTIYGLWNQQIGSFKGLRHTLRPSLSYSYSPDFSTDMWGYYRDMPNDTTGRKYSIFEGGIVGGPGSGESQSISLSLGNVFETKRVKRDTTGEMQTETINLVDNLNANISYNMAAESFKLSNLSLRANSSILGDIRLNADATFSFYEADSSGRRIDTYMWEYGGPWTRMTNLTLRASTSYEGGSERGWRITDPHYPRNYDPLNQRAFSPIDPNYNQRPIQPLRSPWSFSLSFNYSWRFQRPGEIDQKAVINADNIRLRLTPKWNFSTSLGYDFIKKELTPSEFSLNRELHCWRLSFRMRPFGDFQFYMFSLSVNDGQLQSLFQKLPLLNNLERRSSPIGRYN